MADDIFMSLPARIDAMRHVRSTLLISSFATLREAGYEEAYLRALPREHHAEILQSVAGVWIPMPTARAHYDACGTLGLSSERMFELGRSVAARVQGTLLGTVVRMTKNTGVTPWTVMPLFPRFWRRAFDGGGVRGVRLGPKEARLEMHQVELAESAYFRNAVRGLTVSVLELFCSRAYVRELPAPRVRGLASFRVQWA